MRRKFVMPQVDADRLRQLLKEWLTRKKIRLNDRPAIKSALEMGDGSVHALLTPSEDISPELYIRTIYKINGRAGLAPLVDNHNGQSDSGSMNGHRSSPALSGISEDVLLAENERLQERVRELEVCLEKVEKALKCAAPQV